MTEARPSGLPLTPAAIRALIAKVPRLDIAIKNTPLEEARNLSRHLGGPRIFVKRDDLTGVAFGGNKLRNLEFRLACTMQEEPDTVIVGLDLQSNSARQTVGACNRLGLKTILVLEGARPNAVQGNLLVDYLLGAEIHFAADRDAQRAIMDRRAAEVRAAGGRPHILNDNPMFDVASALAYIETTLEVLDQLAERALAPSHVYMSSSGKGQAGILLAGKLLGAGFAMHGVTATDEFHLPSRTAGIARQTLDALGLDVPVCEDEVINFDGYVGSGYGVPSEAGNEAVRLFARTEGIILDPIYTGKAAAGLIDHVRTGRLGRDDVVVFVHTGGTPAVFTWNTLWTGEEDRPAAGGQS
ncbi:pyridoxal-phosphate dependent enzyme [Aquibium sp. A9E412]|uniref:pyridoxal-phosphate dependent enzyme n=1 Tax=Aquibium sp. A9E412 TaxID=2976767 RepID=UPI0025B24AAF|nr:pyridoxal-phosphate dependent enzyme [Aquibium sp. A9E412]MDN2566522.1 pyridoxal-phosphate dependent enzyme [Aquibium sp. A9E412]